MLSWVDAAALGTDPSQRDAWRSPASHSVPHSQSTCWVSRSSTKRGDVEERNVFPQYLPKVKFLFVGLEDRTKGERVLGRVLSLTQSTSY